MTSIILEYGSNLIRAFNDVRNNYSTAHPNELLGKQESTLILENIAATIKFINTIDP